MADDNKGFDSFSFGIQETNLLGNYEAAEDFLSGDDAATITKVEDEEKEKAKAKAKAVPTKKDPKKEEEKEDPETEESEEAIDPLEEIVDEGKKKEKPKEETKEEESEETEETETEESEESKEGNQYEGLYKDLIKLGVFTEQEGEQVVKTSEDLLSRFEAEGQFRATTWLEGYLGQFGPDRRDLFDAIFINGVDPQEYLPVYNQAEVLNNLDLTVEDNQKKVYREYYKRLGWDADKVEKKLQRTIDYGDLEDEVGDLHEQLLAQDERTKTEMEQAGQAKQLATKKADQEYKQGLQKVLTDAIKAKEVKGIPITDKKAREAMDFLYTPKYKTASGQILTEFDKFVLESKKPENLEQRIILALLKLDNFDFTNIKKKAISEESKELFNSLAKQVTKDKQKATKPVESKGSSLWSNL